jgi:hypothetical protein
MSVDFVTNQEIIFAAHRNLAQNVCNYLSGGAESETTMRRNRFGLDSPWPFDRGSLSTSPRSNPRLPFSGTN